MNPHLKKLYVLCVCAAYLVLAITYLSQEPYDHEHENVLEITDVLPRLKKSNSGSPVKTEIDSEIETEKVIPVLILACNRPAALGRVLEQVLQRVDQQKFPVTVSLDCEDVPTKAVVKTYDLTYMEQPDQSQITHEKSSFNVEGYHRLSRHYRWALNQMVNVRHPKSKALIILEDDLDISDDLFVYFSAFSELLEKDKTLLCVSGFNDNGKQENIDDSNPCQLWRSDFFPGLGWMTTSAIVRELLAKWPLAYWDDWLRDPAQSLGRSCIRPEVSKTTTFGEKGVSSGQFYKQHLAKIQLNKKNCTYGAKEVGAMSDKAFAHRFRKAVEGAKRMPSKDLTKLEAGSTVQVISNTLDEWENVSRVLNIMSDVRPGGVRNNYNFVVPTFHRGSRVYVDVRFLAESSNRFDQHKHKLASADYVY